MQLLSVTKRSSARSRPVQLLQHRVVDQTYHCLAHRHTETDRQTQTDRQTDSHGGQYTQQRHVQVMHHTITTIRTTVLYVTVPVHQLTVKNVIIINIFSRHTSPSFLVYADDLEHVLLSLLLNLVPFPHHTSFFLIILNFSIVSPLQRLKHRVSRFRYFRRSEYEHSCDYKIKLTA